MTKKYLIVKLETKETEIPDGYHATIRTKYFGVTKGCPYPHETLEDAEQELTRLINRFEQYTIIPVYSDED